MPIRRAVVMCLLVLPLSEAMSARRDGQPARIPKSTTLDEGVFVEWNGTRYNLEHASYANIFKLIREASSACSDLYTKHGTPEGVRQFKVSNPERYDELKTILQHLPILLLRHDRDLRTSAPSEPMGLKEDHAKGLHKLVFDLRMGALLMIAVDEESTSTLWAAEHVAQELLLRIDRAYPNMAYAGDIFWNTSAIVHPTDGGVEATRAAAAIALAERVAQPLLVPDAAQFAGFTGSETGQLPDRVVVSMDRSIEWLDLAYSIAASSLTRAEIALLAATLCHQAAARALDGITIDALNAEKPGELSRTVVAHSAEDTGLRWAKLGLAAMDEAKHLDKVSEEHRRLREGLQLVYASLAVANLNRRLVLNHSHSGYDSMQRWISERDVEMAREVFLMGTDIRWQSAAVYLDVAAEFNGGDSPCILDEPAPEMEISGDTTDRNDSFKSWFIKRAHDDGGQSAWERDQICMHVVNRAALYEHNAQTCSYQDMLVAIDLKLDCDINPNVAKWHNNVK